MAFITSITINVIRIISVALISMLHQMKSPWLKRFTLSLKDRDNLASKIFLFLKPGYKSNTLCIDPVFAEWSFGNHSVYGIDAVGALQ